MCVRKQATFDYLCSQTINIFQLKPARRSGPSAPAPASLLRTSPRRLSHTPCAASWARSCQLRRSSPVSQSAGRSARCARNISARTRLIAKSIWTLASGMVNEIGYRVWCLTSLGPLAQKNCLYFDSWYRNSWLCDIIVKLTRWILDTYTVVKCYCIMHFYWIWIDTECFDNM